MSMMMKMMATAGTAAAVLALTGCGLPASPIYTAADGGSPIDGVERPVPAYELTYNPRCTSVPADTAALMAGTQGATVTGGTAAVTLPYTDAYAVAVETSTGLLTWLTNGLGDGATFMAATEGDLSDGTRPTSFQLTDAEWDAMTTKLTTCLA